MTNVPAGIQTMRGAGEGGGGAGMVNATLTLLTEPAWLLTRTV
jgi:hypothetical protein